MTDNQECGHPLSGNGTFGGTCAKPAGHKSKQHLSAEAYANRLTALRAREQDPEVKRAWYLANREHVACKRRETMYKVTPERFAQLQAAQEGLCAVCEADLAALPSHKVHIDHDHACCPQTPTCGRCVRGVLCVGCNRQVSHVEAGNANPDDPHRTRAAKKYPPGRIEAIRAYLNRFDNLEHT